MTVLSFPAGIEIKAVRFGLQSNSQAFVSPLSGDTQTASYPGSRWAANFMLVPKTRADMAAVVAFLAQLDGMAGRFYGYDPAATTPLGVGTGTPLVNGASQTGKSLITDGWTAGQTGILKAGDYFTVNNEMKMVTADCDSDGSGNATISFTPALRSSPANNAAITVTNPKCIMRLENDDQAAWDVGDDSFYNISFSAVESFFT